MGKNLLKKIAFIQMPNDMNNYPYKYDFFAITEKESSY